MWVFYGADLSFTVSKASHFLKERWITFSFSVVFSSHFSCHYSRVTFPSGEFLLDQWVMCPKWDDVNVFLTRVGDYLHQVLVDPFCEGLFLDSVPFVCGKTDKTEVGLISCKHLNIIIINIIWHINHHRYWQPDVAFSDAWRGYSQKTKYNNYKTTSCEPGHFLGC